MLRNAGALGKSLDEEGARPSATRRDGSFCTNIGAKALDRIADMACEHLLDLVTKRLRQNGSEFIKRALDIGPLHPLDKEPGGKDPNQSRHRIEDDLRQLRRAFQDRRRNRGNQDHVSREED